MAPSDELGLVVLTPCKRMMLKNASLDSLVVRSLTIRGLPSQRADHNNPERRTQGKDETMRGSSVTWRGGGPAMAVSFGEGVLVAAKVATPRLWTLDSGLCNT